MTIDHLTAAFELDTRLWRNCLDGVDEDQAWERPGPSANSVGFLALHLAESRWFIARQLGLELANPFADRLTELKGIADLHPEDRPSLAELRSAWDTVSAALLAGLRAADPERLAADSPTRFPVADGTVLGGLAFLLHHESYHLGQLAILRKLAGLPAMSYA